MNLLLGMGWSQWLMALLIITLCVLLILVILLQRGRGGGVAAAFGGGGSAAFGAKTGDVFTLITVILASVFLIASVTGVYLFTPQVPVVEPPPEVTPTDAASTPIEETLPLPASTTEPAAPGQTSGGAATPAGEEKPATPPEEEAEDNGGADDL